MNKLAVNNMHKIGLKGINSRFTLMHATQVDCIGDPEGEGDHLPPWDIATFKRAMTHSFPPAGKKIIVAISKLLN